MPLHIELLLLTSQIEPFPEGRYLMYRNRAACARFRVSSDPEAATRHKLRSNSERRNFLDRRTSRPAAAPIILSYMDAIC
jgi:hypothetical protein